MSTEQDAKTVVAVSESDAAAKAAPKGKTELRAEATRARVELAQTLDAIEYKLNVPRQVRVRSRLFTMRLRDFGEKNPLALAGIVLGGVSATVGAVWLGVKAVQRR
ncbi:MULTISPECIES: DUF3618 domain-containing protein [Cryobacterium]|uniref:DUF3618 domain-containing protein n=1 Tax=Cryobacterium breve TaxID=1259258 RepID=A0ABY2IW19_9MICO|nr:MULTISPECIES: DUF3618 domain-containing protein [Cryobacterium]TFC93131.1 DUF3618 domain-containing protein [Cryobacterium sp. TmT3-12]TFC96116.1 DUF3618 domain-containing protein [Cryobacterium breve]